MTSLFALEKERNAGELVRLLRESGNEKVRARAAEILGDLEVHEEEGRPELVEGLIGAARDDESDAVRAAAIDALDQKEEVERLIATMAGKDPDSEGGADWVRAELFAEALTSSRPEMRMAAANVLGRIGDRAATRTLVEQLRDPERNVRARVARALGRIGDPRATDALAARLRDPSVEVRREAAEALALVGGDAALAALVGLFEDENETIRYIAASSLGNFASAKPVDPLARALGDESDAVRRAAVFSLIELLSNAPPARSHELRETVVETLGATEDPNVILALSEIVDEGMQSHQRRNATWLLGRITGTANREVAISSLIGVLDDDDGMTAQFAAASLASIGGSAVETALLEVLDDRDATTEARAKAAFTLGKVGSDRSREYLDGLVETAESEEIRRRAFAALSKLGGRRG